MASNLEPYTLAISADKVSAGHKVKALNRNTGESVTEKFNSSGEAVIDLSSFDSLSDNDVIELSILGGYIGFAVHTVNGVDSKNGGVEVDISTSAVSADFESVSI